MRIDKLRKIIFKCLLIVVLGLLVFACDNGGEVDNGPYWYTLNVKNETDQDISMRLALLFNELKDPDNNETFDGIHFLEEEGMPLNLKANGSKTYQVAREGFIYTKPTAADGYWHFRIVFYEDDSFETEIVRYEEDFEVWALTEWDYENDVLVKEQHPYFNQDNDYPFYFSFNEDATSITLHIKEVPTAE